MFRELLLLIVVPVRSSGSRTAKKCVDGSKSDLFPGSVLKLCYAEITNWKDNKRKGSLLQCNPLGKWAFLYFSMKSVVWRKSLELDLKCCVLDCNKI